VGGRCTAAAEEWSGYQRPRPEPPDGVGDGGKQRPEAVVRLLLENGVETNDIDDHGRSISHLARGGNIGIINLLIDLGLDINVKDKRGESILRHAASRGSLEAVERILQLHPVVIANPFTLGS
jgi:ankyrin repeat protein